MSGNAIDIVVDGQAHRFEPGDRVTLDGAPDNRVVIDGPAISSHHAELTHDGTRWVLRDLGSTNGTFVGAERVTETPLTSPTLVRIGAATNGIDVQFRPEQPPVPPAAPPPPPPGASAVGAAGAAALGTGTIDIRTLGVGSGAPPLTVSAAGKRREFPAGSTVHIGRDSGCEVSIDDDLVSGRHGNFAYQHPQGWVYTDTSRNGTYVDGKRLKAPLTIVRPATLCLGAPSGAEVEAGPILSEQEEAAVAAKERGRKNRRLVALGAMAVVVLAGVVGLVVALAGSNGSSSQGLSTSALQRAKKATVYLQNDDKTGWGSGTIISPDGLILTNAHVAKPSAPGLDVTYGGAPANPNEPPETDPKFLYVGLTKQLDSPVKVAYRAKVVNYDGYLDFAVVKIYADTNGNNIDPADLHLPTLPVGSVQTLHEGDGVTTLGFPGLSDSQSVTVTKGQISTWVPDRFHRVDFPRYQIDTSARIGHGNSGGAAIDDKGVLIGVPSAGIPGQGTDVSNRLRSVDLALPQIDAAKQGKDYTSPWVVTGTGDEKLVDAGVSETEPQGCPSPDAGTRLPDGLTQFYVQLSMDNMRKGEDVWVAVVPQGTDQPADKLSPVVQWQGGSSGCQNVLMPVPVPKGAEAKLSLVVFAGSPLQQLGQLDVRVG